MARQNITLGTVFGIQINVSFSWFVIFGLVTVLLATAYFPEAYPGLPRYGYLGLGLLTSILFFGSVLLHELSHSLVAKMNKIDIRSITLFIFGGVSHMDRDPDSPGAEFWMAVAGPFASFALSGLFGLIYSGAAALKIGVAVTGPALYLMIINLYLGIFNLVPGFPLDGGRVLRAILWKITGNVRSATRVASIMGQVFAAVLIVTGLYMLFIARAFWLNGLWFIFIGVFLQQVAVAGYEEVILHWTLAGVKVKDIMTTDVVTVEATIIVSDLVNDYFMRLKHNRFPVVEEGAVIGIVTLDDVKDLPRERWETTRTRAITPPLKGDESVAPEATAEEAIARMTSTRRGHLIVMEGAKLAGIITMNDLAGAIEVRRHLGA